MAYNKSYLTYNLPVGVWKPAKLKHIVTKEELIKFIKYLNSKKLYVIIIMCMLMYKFCLRFGALAKLKANDLLPDNIIKFKEKNSKLIKRKLLLDTSNLLRLLINECKIDNNKYLFYFFEYEDDEDKRSLFFIQNLEIYCMTQKLFHFLQKNPFHHIYLGQLMQLTYILVEI